MYACGTSASPIAYCCNVGSTAGNARKRPPPHSHSNGYPNRDTNTHANPDGSPNGDPNIYAECDANPDADCESKRNAA